MLYPDLRRLSLRSPATGAAAGEVLVPDTPPPPKRHRQQEQPQEAEEEETPQQVVLRQEGLLNLILFGLVDDDDVQSTCANAVKWCDLAKGHQGSCDANVWQELTRRVFPNLQVPSFLSEQVKVQPQEASAIARMYRTWFVYFCKEHKKLRDLKKGLASQTRAIAEQYSGMNRVWMMRKADKMELEVQIEALETMGRDQFVALPTSVRQALNNRIFDLGEAKREVQRAMERAWHSGAKPSLLVARAMHNREWAQRLRKIKVQEMHIRSYEKLPPGTHGPQTIEELLEKERLHALERLTRMEERHQASYAQWLRDRERHHPWERDLSALVGEARALIEQNPRVPLSLLSDVAQAVVKVDRARREAYPFWEDYRKGPEYYDVVDNLQSRIGRFREWLEEYPGRAGV